MSKLAYPAIIDRTDLPAVFRSVRCPRPNCALTGRLGSIGIPDKEAPMSQPNANQIKHALRKQGHTLKSWALANGFKYRDVSEVVRGIRRGNYGTGRDIRIKLGLPIDEQIAA